MQFDIPVNAPTPMTASLGWIPSGKDGTVATLRIMGRFVREGKKALPVRSLALHLVQGLPQKDWAGEVSRIHAFVRDKIRYVKDVKGVETLQTPEKTLEIGQGDCDDKSVLVAALLESVGHPTRFVAIALKHPDEFEHVFVETKIGANWVGVETTEPVELGWQPKGVKKRLIFYN